ncbi:MAG: metallophosphoesterase [Victivallaceae bacterium]
MIKKRHLKWTAAAILTVSALVLLVCRALIWEPAMITVSHRTIELDRWHDSLNGFKVAVLADLHQTNTPGELERTRRIVEITNREEPDLILLPGDFIGRRHDRKSQNAAPAEIAGLLRPLRAKYGVYAVLGNHDHWHDGPAVASALQSVGIKVLENETAELEINGCAVNLIGLPDRMTRHRTLRLNHLPPVDEPAIVLSHSPDYFDELKLPYELMVSGHYHGGQIRLPWFGALLIPSPYGRKYEGRFYQHGGRKLLISFGLGTSIIKARLCCAPEIVMLKLSQKNNKSEEAQK